MFDRHLTLNIEMNVIDSSGIEKRPVGLSEPSHAPAQNGGSPNFTLTRDNLCDGFTHDTHHRNVNVRCDLIEEKTGGVARNGNEIHRI